MLNIISAKPDPTHPAHVIVTPSAPMPLPPYHTHMQGVRKALLLNIPLRHGDLTTETVLLEFSGGVLCKGAQVQKSQQVV